jgi:predicted metal-dependent HD superfamily phosphohydrolase
VVEQVKLIGFRSGLLDKYLELLELAAWFHDIGYHKDSACHEALGASMAEEFLLKAGMEKSKTEEIKKLILATVFTASPANLPEEVIRDADLSYLGTTDFDKISEGLRIEWERTKGMVLTDLEWVRINISFLLTHTYHTDYALTHLEPMKRVNLRMTKAKLVNLMKDNPEN